MTTYGKIFTNCQLQENIAKEFMSHHTPSLKNEESFSVCADLQRKHLAELKSCMGKR